MKIENLDVIAFPFTWKSIWKPYPLAIRIATGAYTHVGICLNEINTGLDGPIVETSIIEAVWGGFIPSPFSGYEQEKRAPFEVYRLRYDWFFDSPLDIEAYKFHCVERIKKMEGQKYDVSAIFSFPVRILLGAPYRKLRKRPLFDTTDEVFCSEAVSQALRLGGPDWLEVTDKLKPKVDFQNVITLNNLDDADVTPTMIAKSPAFIKVGEVKVNE